MGADPSLIRENAKSREGGVENSGFMTGNRKWINYQVCFPYDYAEHTIPIFFLGRWTLAGSPTVCSL